MRAMDWSWLFLLVTIVGALFTFNAYLPRPANSRLAAPSFFAGWLTSELVAHHFAWQLAATLFFVWAGALDAWPGWLGLAITFASWAALLAMVPVARRSEHEIEDALQRGLGAAYRDAAEPSAAKLRDAFEPQGRLVNPFRFRHPEVRVVHDIRYAEGAGKRHLLDVYTPRDGASGAPVLLQIHGGGWTIGHKRQQALPLLNHLAARGWVCVAANYRLSPRATFPEHIIDVKLAIRWIREHIAEYGGDARFLAVTGGSAGGHLTALAGLTANDPEYQPGFEDVDTRVQAAVPFYGVYDFTDRQGLDRRRGFVRFLERIVIKKKFATDREAFERASPMSRVRSDAPPFLVIHGALDSLVPVQDARHFAALLRSQSQAPVCYAELSHAQHAFEVFHSLRTRNIVRGVDRFLAAAYAAWVASERSRDAA
jgi:acetyl esterase/lipase